MAETDERPDVWVGHVLIGATDVKKSADYWTKLGMRVIVSRDQFAVLELRGGTHLIVQPAGQPIEPDTPAPFDVMVDDIQAARKRYAELGFEPSELTEGTIHSSFTMTDPSGYRVLVNSSHVGDLPV